MSKHFLKNIPQFDRRVRAFTVALGVALSFVAPTFLTTLASAAQITTRSVQLSTSAKAAQGVSYTVGFTPVNSAGAVVIEFCSNSPFLNSTCDAPSNFSASNAASATSGFTDVTGSTNKIIVAGTITAPTPVSIVITGINNPDAVGPFYARIVTYASKTDAQNGYTSANIDASSVSHKDEGGAAMSITDTIGVTAAVLETMTFCAAGESIGTNCDLTGKKKPTLALGETVGSVVALDPTHLSTGSIFTQISTNAAHGAIVNLKSNTTSCGGLKRAGDPSACDIAPALNAGITAGEAKFGVKTTDATAPGSGTFQPAAGSIYNKTTYALNYVSGNATGITSPYGDPFLDTGGSPVNNKNMELVFGASVTNSTPAGSYSADISLIATGTF